MNSDWATTLNRARATTQVRKAAKATSVPPQSGNPKGRSKGAKKAATLLQDILGRKIEVRTGSRLRKMTVLEAMLTRFAESAVKSRAHLPPSIRPARRLPSSPVSAGGWRHD
jgi:uncharacterized protein DUF5681